MALSILSLNCNGLRDQSKRLGLLQWLRSMPVSPDIVCLQEAHCLSVAECSLWFRSSGCLSALSPGSSHSCGCIILFRPTLSLLNSWSDSAGRFAQSEFSFMAKTFVFVQFIVQIVILIVICFWMTLFLGLIPLSPLFLLVILILFLTGLLTVVAPILVTLLERVLYLLAVYLMLVVLLIFGGIFTLPRLFLPGLVEMVI